jgi:hypothetical protein
VPTQARATKEGIVNSRDAYGSRNGGTRSSSGRRPDYILKTGLRGEKYHVRCGAAWRLKSGGIAIKIDPGIALVSGTDVVVSLWPNEEQQQRAPQPNPHLMTDDEPIPY